MNHISPLQSRSTIYTSYTLVSALRIYCTRDRLKDFMPQVHVVHKTCGTLTGILENVEHCGGEPEQADRILMSDVTYSTFGVQCKLTQWNPH